MIKNFLKQEKWIISLFSLTTIIGYITSTIFMGGPATYSGPIGAWIGFLIYETWNYRSFKKEWKTKESTWNFR